MLSAVKNKIQSLKQELSSYTSQQRAFVLFAMLCGFCITCEYSIIRPVCNSLFIHAFGTKVFPYVWMAVVPFNFLIVSLYNKFIIKVGYKRLFIYFVTSVILINVLFALLYKTYPFLTFFFYIWKEMYVVLMFQMLWSVIHSNIPAVRSKYLYGILFGVGGLGSMLGSFFPSFCAVSYGSENLIFLTVPVYLTLLFVYLKMSHYSSGNLPKEEKEGGFLHGVQLISRSRFLIFALLIVIFMQMIATIVDFQFNNYLEKAFSQKDVRTEYTARIFGIIHTSTVLFQFIGSYALIQFFGFKRTHYLIPTILGSFASLLLCIPIFPVVSLMFILTRSLDFSLFGVIKEMLYVPLKPDEKFRAKAVIDVFAYRSAKAIASLLILFLTSFLAIQSLTWVVLTLALLWTWSVAYGLHEYGKLVKEDN